MCLMPLDLLFLACSNVCVSQQAGEGCAWHALVSSWNPPPPSHPPPLPSGPRSPLLQAMSDLTASSWTLGLLSALLQLPPALLLLCRCSDSPRPRPCCPLLHGRS